MKEVWKKKPFADCIAKVSYTHKLQRTEFLTEGAYPVVSQETNLINGYWNDKEYLIKIRSPVIIFGDHNKIIKYIDFDFVRGADGVKILHPLEFLLPKFFYYQLQAAKLDSLGYARHYRLLKQLEIAYPSIQEQQRIIDIIDEAFGYVDTANDNTEKNLQNARALFGSHLKAVFMQDNHDWVKTRLGDVAETQYGLSEPMNEEGNGFKIFRMGELQDGRLTDTGRMKHVEIDKTEFLKYKLSQGDILFNRTNSFELVGKTGIFKLRGDYCFASYLVRVLVNQQAMLPEFLNYLMNSEQFQTSVKQKASRSINQANINATILANERVQFPSSLMVQRSIVNQLNSLNEQTQRLEFIYQKKLSALDGLKKSLLHQAFSGQL